MKILNLFENAKEIAWGFTMVYVWSASCLYLAYNVNYISANACFYGGVAWFVLALITSPQAKRKYWKDSHSEN
jgi:hypothetical protein|tara:strand:+ start:12141 stop:12359 length:219 start_codon:yes stop_codon:yes gene_type:complete